MADKQFLPLEEWRIVPGLTSYECSNLGRFRNATTGRIKSININVLTGRRFATFFVTRGRQKTFYTAALIATAWLGEKPPGMQIDHINGIKTDERIANLEYVTQEENIQRSFDNGQHPYRPGIRPHLTEDDYAKVREMSRVQKLSQCEIGRRLGIHNSTVSKILSGKISPRRIGPSIVRQSRAERREHVQAIKRARVNAVRAFLAEYPNVIQAEVAIALDFSPKCVSNYVRIIKAEQEQQ